MEYHIQVHTNTTLRGDIGEILKVWGRPGNLSFEIKYVLGASIRLSRVPSFVLLATRSHEHKFK